jgi:hypothetical protein
MNINQPLLPIATHTQLNIAHSSRGCGYVGNWDVCSYPHIHQPQYAMVTFSLNTSG